MPNPPYYLLLICCALLLSQPARAVRANFPVTFTATGPEENGEQQLRASAEEALRQQFERDKAQLQHLRAARLLSAADCSTQLLRLEHTYAARQVQIAGLSKQLSALNLYDASLQALQALNLFLQGNVDAAAQRLQGEALAGGTQQRLQRLLQAAELSAADAYWLQQLAFEYNTLLLHGRTGRWSAGAALRLSAPLLQIDELFYSLYPREPHFRRLLAQSLLHTAELTQGSAGSGSDRSGTAGQRAAQAGFGSDRSASAGQRAAQAGFGSDRSAAAGQRAVQVGSGSDHSAAAGQRAAQAGSGSDHSGTAGQRAAQAGSGSDHSTAAGQRAAQAGSGSDRSATAAQRLRLQQGLSLWKELYVAEGGSAGSRYGLARTYELLLQQPMKRAARALYAQELQQLRAGQALLSWPGDAPAAAAQPYGSSRQQLLPTDIDCNEVDAYKLQLGQQLSYQLLSLYLMEEKLDMVSLVNEVMRFGKLRSEMGNPANYPQFDSIYQKIAAALPEKDRLSKAQLTDAQQRLKEVLNAPMAGEIAKMTSGAQLTKVFSGVLHVLTGVNVESIVVGIKGIIANTYNYQRLSGLRDADVQRRQQEAILMHRQLDTLLAINRKELQDFSLELEQSAAISAQVAELREQLLAIRHRLAEKIHLPEDADVRAELTGTDVARRRAMEDNILQLCMASGPSCEGELTTFINAHTDYVVDMKSYNQRIELARAEYLALISNFVNHYRDMELSLRERPNPFSEQADKSSHEAYEKMRAQALQSLVEINKLIVSLFGSTRA